MSGTPAGLAVLAVILAAPCAFCMPRPVLLMFVLLVFALLVFALLVFALLVFALLVPWPCGLLAAAWLAWSSRTSHPPLRSRRSFAQYSSRFLISRSKPRSGGS
jgi:hypothetical protein